MNITITIPTYDEAENLPRLVSALFSLSLPDLRLIIIDDNSPDGTGELAEKLALQHEGLISVLHRAGKMGLGSAYIAGFKAALAAGADSVLQMDADFSHPVEKVPELLHALDNCDFAIGSRYVPGGRLDDRWPLWRKALSGWGNFYARTLLGLPIRDVTGGFKLWRSTTLRALPLDRIRSNGYVFQVELNYLATRLGFRSIEIPIYFADRRWGKSKMNFRIQLEAAVRTLQLPALYKDIKARG